MNNMLIETVPRVANDWFLNVTIPMEYEIKGAAKFYTVNLHSFTLIRLEGPTKIGFSFEESTGNVVFEVEGLSLALDVDAGVSAMWFIPATV